MSTFSQVLTWCGMSAVSQCPDPTRQVFFVIPDGFFDGFARDGPVGKRFFGSHCPDATPVTKSVRAVEAHVAGEGLPDGRHQCNYRRILKRPNAAAALVANNSTGWPPSSSASLNTYICACRLHQGIERAVVDFAELLETSATRLIALYHRS